METLSLIGILLSLALFMLLVYKGWSLYWVAPICVIVIAIFGGISPIEAFDSGFVPALLEDGAGVLQIMLFGGILSRIYVVTGAADAIAAVISRIFVGNRTGKGAVYGVVLGVTVLSALFTLGGINAYVQLMTTLPICLALCEQTNIPRRFVPAMLMLSAPFRCIPGAANNYNIFTMRFMEQAGAPVVNNFGLVGGWIGSIACAVAAWYLLSRMIIKAVNNHEVFEAGGLTVGASEGEKPNIIFAVIPLVIVFVLYSLVGLNVSLTLVIAILVALVTMYKYIPAAKEKEGTGLHFPDGGNRIIAVVNSGTMSFADTLLKGIFPAGLAAVVTMVSGYTLLVNLISSFDVAPVWLSAVATAVFSGVTCSPVAGLSLGIPLSVEIAQSSGAVFNAGAIARTAVIASSTLETLPMNGAVVMAIALAKCNHKGSYGGIFMVSVLATGIGTVVCALIYTLFPALP